MSAWIVAAALLLASMGSTPGSQGPLDAKSVPGALWTRALTGVTWPSRDSHAALVFRDKLWVLGGWGTGPLNDVWSSEDAVDWHLVTAGAPWPARKAMAAVVFQDRLWILGGATGGAEQANDVWSSPDGAAWTKVTDAAPWSRRHNHAAVVFKGKIWLLGGWGGQDLNDVWSSPDGAHWSRVTAAAPWSGRNGHSATVFDGRLWVLGGWGKREKGGDGNLNDVWSSADGARWKKSAGRIPWAPRNHQSAVVYGDKLWVLGGWGETGQAGAQEGNLNDVWATSDGADWRPVTGQAQWLPRNGHASVVFRNRMWVIGGWSHFIGGSSVNDLWSSGS
jgi:N-acetylneuraminic acid mutarotase